MTMVNPYAVEKRMKKNNRPISINFAKGLIEYNRTELLRLYQLELDSGR
jgi:hypothetical protein